MSCPNYYFKSLNCFSHNPTFTRLLCEYTSFTLCYFTINVYEPLPGIYICIYVWILSSFFEYLKFSGFTTKRCFKNLIYSIFTAMICVHWLEYLWSFLRNRFKLLEKKLYIFFVILFPLSDSCLIFFSIELLNFYSQFWFHNILYSWKLTICCNEMRNFINGSLFFRKGQRKSNKY
jgi:hypothetical protein